MSQVKHVAHLGRVDGLARGVPEPLGAVLVGAARPVGRGRAVVGASLGRGRRPRASLHAGLGERNSFLQIIRRGEALKMDLW